MFSSINGLGELQAQLPNWYGVKEKTEGDVDFISTQYYSPDASYPPKRIALYDTELEQHQTLNDNGYAKVSAPFRGFMGKAILPMLRTRYGAPPSRANVELTPAGKPGAHMAFPERSRS